MYSELGVVIATKNRHELVKPLLEDLRKQKLVKFPIVVVDSTEVESRIYDFSDSSSSIIHIYSTVKSLTVQKNIGVQYLRENFNVKFFAVIDDDVRFTEFYLSTLLNLLKINIDFIGIAPGVVETLKTRIKPAGLKGLMNRVFLLDSVKGGRILRSGVNVPLRLDEIKTFTAQELVETEWIYGCAMWRVNGNIFENDLMGQSVYEDVLYSSYARKIGKIGVAVNLILNHLEEKQSRPNAYDFTKMWLRNRRKILEHEPNKYKKRYFIWADFGNLVTNILSPKTKFYIKRQVISAYLSNHFYK